MVKTMCNICGRSTVGKHSIYNPILGRVCGDCLENIYRRDVDKSIQVQIMALQSIISDDISKHPYSHEIFEAIRDSLMRYRMVLVDYSSINNEISLIYHGEYRRADVLIEIKTNQLNGSGVIIPVRVVVYNINSNKPQRVYVEREFGKALVTK